MQFTTLTILKYGSGDLVASHVQLFVNLWTVAGQASLSMGFSMQEY